MKLAPQQVLQGMFHDDINVRQHCLDYFVDPLPNDSSVMSAVIGAIEARGAETFHYFSSIRELPQSDATIEWTIKTLEDKSLAFASHDRFDWRDYLLTHCDSTLLERHQTAILAVLKPESHATVHRRLQFAAQPAEVLWRHLQDICERQLLDVDNPYPEEEANDLVLALAERRFPASEQLVQLLQEEFPNDVDHLMSWLGPHIIEIAGRCHYHSVLPHLIQLLRLDNDYISVESQRALIRLGTDDVVRAIADAFPQEEWYWQNYAGEVFKNIHSDESIHRTIALLRDDSIEESIQQILAYGLTNQFSTEALGAIGEYLESHDDWCGNVEWHETLNAMEVTGKLLDFPLPRLAAWKERMSTAREQQAEQEDEWEFDDMDDEDDFRSENAWQIVHDTPRVGRNDLCPCGSGKKFKKCCMNQDHDR